MSQTLINQYEKKLAKVKEFHGNDAFKGADYIAYAEGELEAVKAGGMDGLIGFWASYECALNTHD
jgi:hypothetical protein